MISDRSLVILENELNHFSLEKRKKALFDIHQAFWGMERPQKAHYVKINLHAHTFFSFNAYGLSPSALAWKAKKEGLDFIGIVDFDVVDGVSEFLEACELLGMKGVAGIETRVFIPSYKAIEINSPGEPGIAYLMGTGITASSMPDTIRSEFNTLRQRAEDRNLKIIHKLNGFLTPFSLNYEVDILPLSPLGNITERHIVQELVDKTSSELESPEAFWQEKLSLSKDAIAPLMADRIKLENTIRKILIKRGGVAYVKPDPQNFPKLEEFNRIIKAADAIPCMAWLDGTSEGEQDIERLFDLMLESGVSALNIVPNRNWNIADKHIKARKIEALNKVVALANDMHVPILIGTEMNSYGQKFVDDLSVPELTNLQDSFHKGALFIYGHTRLQRLWGLGYQSTWANEHLKNREKRVSFYADIGKVIPPGILDEEVQKKISSALSPKEMLSVLSKLGDDK